MSAEDVEFNLHKADGKYYISALELYYWLKDEKTKQFKTWFKNLIPHGFIESIDYHIVTHTEPKEGGGFCKTTDYYLTIDTAKDISTIHKTETGRILRIYFKHLNPGKPNNIEDQINKIEDVYSETYLGYSFIPQFRLSVKKFINRLGFEQVLENMEQCCRYDNHNASTVLKYFCGICWNQINEQ